ncbi:hypothetical protein Tco_1491906 [Tanacetum coccineum]
MTLTNHCVDVLSIIFSYAYSESLLLTPLCCDDIHEVTPRVFALAGCDRLISEPLVIKNYVSLIRKKFCSGTIFPIGLKRYSDPKEEPIEKEPLMELVAKPLASLTQKIRKYEWAKEQEEAFQTLKDNLYDAPILSLPDGSKELKFRSHVLWAEIGEIRSIGSELVQETTNKVMLIKEKLKVARDCSKSYVGNMQYLADTNLHVHLEEIKVDKTLRFAEELVEIIDHEVKSLKRSRIPIVKSIGTRSEVMRIS